MSINDCISRYVADNVKLSPSIREDIARVRADLYDGPLYLDADGEECSCFDEGATQFDFEAACVRIGDALADVSGFYADVDAGDWSTALPEPFEDDDGEIFEPDLSEWAEVDRRQVIAHIVGDELARYVD